MIGAKVLKMVRGDKRWPSYFMLYFLFYIASIWPFLGLRYLPFTDLPQHIAAGAAVKDIILGGPLSQKFWFESLFPNVLGWFFLALLNIPFDMLTAAKVVVLLYFAIAPLSVCYCTDANRTQLSLMSFMFINSYALNMGFLNYVMSVPLLFFSLGAYRRDARAFYVFSSLLFFSHAATYCIFVFILFLQGRPKGGRLRKFAYATLFLGLFLCLVLLHPSDKADDLDGLANSVTSMDLPHLFFYGVITNFCSSIFNGFQFFRPDYVCLFGFSLISLIYMRQILLDREYDKGTLEAMVFILTLIIFFPPIIPLGEGVWHIYAMRFFPLVALLLITDLRPEKKLVSPLVVISFGLVLLNSLSLVGPYRESDLRLKIYYEPLYDRLPEGKSIFVVDETDYLAGYSFTSKKTYGVSPYVAYFPGYYSIKGLSSSYFGEGVSSYQWPLHYSTPMPYRLCYSNISYSCHVCDKKGFEFFYPDESGASEQSAEGPQAVNCTRPMALICKPSGSGDGEYLLTDTCIPCRSANLSCILNSSILKEKFDYLIAYSNSDDISDYRIDGLEPYYANEDLIVYETGRGIP